MENKFNDLRTKYSLSNKLNIDGDKNINALKNITSYSLLKNDTLIEELKEEIEEQQDLKKLLLDKNIEENSKLLFDFIDNNQNKIEQQFNEIKKLSNELKNLVNENNNLKEKEKLYETFLQSEKTCDLDVKINELNSIKKELKLFLKKNNIYLESI